MSNGGTHGSSVLFRGVRVFDGIASARSGPTDVLVTGSTIASIGGEVAAAAPGEERVVIDGAGKTLMPGLIDAHWHAAFTGIGAFAALLADPAYLHLIAGREAGRTLDRGFTTVRDAGGPTFGLKAAIDEGVIAGPRIFPSGAFITQTSGHGDFRFTNDLSGNGCNHLHHIEANGVSAIADGVPAVLQATREQLMRGASQIKVMAGGGVSSAYDPIDVTQYTPAELRAAVEAAENWGTYVMVHAYTSRAVRQCIEAGVRCIEHGHLIEEDVVELMAERGTWWCLQPFLDDEDSDHFSAPDQRAKHLQVVAGTDRAYELAIRHGVQLGWGTDILFDPSKADRQGHMLTKLTRWFGAADILRLATSGNAELLALSGLRNPYPGRLGVVAEGALADLLLVDGDPLADLSVIEDPEHRFLVIMKDGQIHKNLAPSAA